MRNARATTRPLMRERLDLTRRNAADGRRPLGRLRLAVLLAEDVVLEPIESVGMRCDVVLVVEVLGHPHIRDGGLQSSIGVRQHRDPLVGMDSGTVVEVGAHVHLLNADLGKPEAVLAGNLTLPAPRRRLHVAAPEQQHVGVLGNVEQQISHIELAERILSPHVLGTPVPAFPRVGLTRLIGPIVAEQIHKTRIAAMGSMDNLRLSVTVALHEDRRQPVGVDYAPDFARDEIGRLIPGDPHELALASIFRMAIAVRIPVDALVRIENSVLRIDSVFVRIGIRRKQRLHRRMKLAPPRLDRPRLQVLGRIFLVVTHRTHAHDAVVFDIDLRHIGPDAERIHARCLVDGFLPWQMTLLLRTRKGLLGAARTLDRTLRLFRVATEGIHDRCSRSRSLLRHGSPSLQ